MKKQNLKSLSLVKKSISNLDANHQIKGGLHNLKKSRRWWNCPAQCTAYCHHQAQQPVDTI